MLASTPCGFSLLWVLSLVPRSFSLGTLERLPFVWKTRKFRGEFKWNRSSWWKLSGKKEYLSRYYLFPVLTKRPKFSVPFCLDYQCQASCREKLKNLPVFCKWYNSIPFLLSVPEKYQYHMTEIFTEISVQMGSAPGVPLSSRTTHPNSGTARDAFKRVI